MSLVARLCKRPHRVQNVITKAKFSSASGATRVHQGGDNYDIVGSGADCSDSFHSDECDDTDENPFARMEQDGYSRRRAWFYLVALRKFSQSSVLSSAASSNISNAVSSSSTGPPSNVAPWKSALAVWRKMAEEKVTPSLWHISAVLSALDTSCPWRFGKHAFQKNAVSSLHGGKDDKWFTAWKQFQSDIPRLPPGNIIDLHGFPTKLVRFALRRLFRKDIAVGNVDYDLDLIFIVGHGKHSFGTASLRYVVVKTLGDISSGALQTKNIPDQPGRLLVPAACLQQYFLGRVLPEDEEDDF